MDRFGRDVRERGTIRRRTLSAGVKPEKKQKILRREINLLKTLATTVVLFVLCWVPYGVCIIVTQGHTPTNVKKVSNCVMANSNLAGLWQFEKKVVKKLKQLYINQVVFVPASELAQFVFTTPT